MEKVKPCLYGKFGCLLFKVSISNGESKAIDIDGVIDSVLVMYQSPTEKVKRNVMELIISAIILYQSPMEKAKPVYLIGLV